MINQKFPPLRAFVVDDEFVQRRGVVELLKDAGYDVVAECDSFQTALEYLKHDNRFNLVMVDKQIPEDAQHRSQEGIGPNLLLMIKKEFPFVGPLVLYTSLDAPNIGDIQRVYQAGASALSIPREAEENFAKALALIGTGHQVLSPLFSRLGAGAVDPKYQNPLDPVEYYCARLICEHRGKKGSAEKWNISENMIDELLDDIYDKMSTFIRDFADLPKEKKQQALARWYHDHAVPLYGAAAPADYEPRKNRRKKWPQIVFNEDSAIAL